MLAIGIYFLNNDLPLFDPTRQLSVVRPSFQSPVSPPSVWFYASFPNNASYMLLCYICCRSASRLTATVIFFISCNIFYLLVYSYLCFEGYPIYSSAILAAYLGYYRGRTSRVIYQLSGATQFSLCPNTSSSAICLPKIIFWQVVCSFSHSAMAYSSLLADSNLSPIKRQILYHEQHQLGIPSYQYLISNGYRSFSSYRRCE